MTATEEAASRAPLSASRIVAEAVAMADEGGVEAVSMRKLADRLEYGVMSLYNHIPNKDDLLARMVDAVAAEIAPPPPSEAPLAAIRSVAVSTHDALAQHRWAAGVWLQCLPGPARSARMEDLLRLFNSSGLSSGLAHHGFHAITNHVLGYTMQQVSMTLADEHPTAKAEEYLQSLPTDEFPHMIAHVHQHLRGDTASSFELVLDLILEGLVRRNDEV